MCGVCGLALPLALNHPDLPLLGCAGPAPALARVVRAGFAGCAAASCAQPSGPPKLPAPSVAPAQVLAPGSGSTAIEQIGHGSHNMHRVRFEGCDSIFVCLRCGAYTSARVNAALKAQCPGGAGGPRDSGRLVLNRLRDGKHPSRVAKFKRCLVIGRPEPLAQLERCSQVQSDERARTANDKLRDLMITSKLSNLSCTSTQRPTVD